VTKRLSDPDEFVPDDEVEVSRMPLMEHLKELRYRIMVSGGTLIASMFVGMSAANTVFAFLTAPIRLLLEGGKSYPEVDAFYLWLTSPMRAALPIVFDTEKVSGTLAMTTSPLEGIGTWFSVALYTAAAIASPVIAYQGWQFVAPGLYATERKVVIPLAFASTMLFFLGMSFGYLIMVPVVMPFFLRVLEVEAILSVEGYLNTLMKMLLAFGVSFQLPIVVWFGARLGFIDHTDMIKGFRYAVVVLFVIAAIVTPPDVLTQILVGVPMTLLYILSIGVAYIWTTKVREPEEEG